MERWRSFFGSSGEDLWTVIDRAITIAAIDYPQELRVRRDAFAEKLFAPASSHFPPKTAEGPQLDGRAENLFDPNLCPLTSSIGERPALTRSDGGTGASPESETANVLEDQHMDPEGTILKSSVVENLKPLKEEAVKEESEESRQIREILVIKEHIMNFDQGEEACLLQLSKLENMNICVPALKETGIGKPVNGLRKHSSRRVRSVVKRLVRTWKDVVDEWVGKRGDDFAVAFIDSGTLHVNGSNIGTTSPCQNYSQVPANVAGSTKILDIREDKITTESWRMDSRHIAAESYDASLPQPQSNFQVSNIHKNSHISDSKTHRAKWEHEYNLLDKEPYSRHRSHISTEKRFEHVTEGTKASTDCVGNDANRLDAVHPAPHPPHPSEVTSEQNLFISKAGTEMKPKCKETANELIRLEAAKRRLHENYRQADNVKKQRILQVVGMDSLPRGTSIDSIQLKSNWTGSVKPGVHAKRVCSAIIR